MHPLSQTRHVGWIFDPHHVPVPHGSQYDHGSLALVGLDSAAEGIQVLRRIRPLLALVLRMVGPHTPQFSCVDEHPSGVGPPGWSRWHVDRPRRPHPLVYLASHIHRAPVATSRVYQPLGYDDGLIVGE